MAERNRRRISALVGVAAIILVVVIYLLVTRLPGSVDVPGDDATPDEGVAAHTAALDPHDCDTAKALAWPVPAPFRPAS